MSGDKEIILYHETLMQSIISDTFTYGGLLGCLYVSITNSSKFFTLLFAAMMIMAGVAAGTNSKKFRSKDELIEYLTAKEEEVIK